jgi:ribosomal protein S18 acetylase RimI-like enzyme
LITDVDQRRIEAAALRAWPALEEARLEGWTLRCSDGVSKRANSVQALRASDSPIAERVTWSEHWYASRNRPCIFRLTPFSESGLDSLLADRGYDRIEPTDVLHCGIASAPPASAPGRLRPLRLDHWLQTYAAFSDWHAGAPAAFGRIVGAIPPPALLAVLMDEPGAKAVACGIAVADDDLVGLENLVVREDARRRGYGAELVRHLIAWGATRGATRAYLLVSKANLPAQRLYRKLGFEPAYEYWYRSRRAP